MLAVLNTVKGEFKNIYVKIPCPEVDQALLKIYQCGICGSDIQIYHGLHPFAKKPLVMGHECVAEVVRTGSGVLDLVPGDLVTVQPQIFCHTCQACRSGHSNVCENMNFMGVHTDGFFAEYAAVPAWNVLRLDHGISRDAAMLTEPVAVAVNAARKGRVMTGMRVAVVGAGTIGNLTAQVCRCMGAEVLITDIQDSKLDLAEKCGIDHCVNTSATDLREGTKGAFHGRKADLIIDCAAVPSVFEQIVAYAANGSGVVLVGNYKKAVEIDLSKIQRREIDIHGVMQYSRDDFTEAIRLLETGQIKTEGIISGHFPLTELKAAFEYIDQHPDTMKVAVTMD